MHIEWGNLFVQLAVLVSLLTVGGVVIWAIIRR